MARIRSANTKPEMAVRRIVWSMGRRYRLHVRTLPGTPDLVFRKDKKVVFVHGCFWHMHEGCKRATLPRTRPGYWLPKLAENKRRDCDNISALAMAGWDVLVIWECELRAPKLVARRLQDFLD